MLKKLATPQNTGYQLRDRDATELLQIVNQTASQAGFTADRINYEGQGGLQIWASDVPFANGFSLVGCTSQRASDDYRIFS